MTSADPTQDLFEALGDRSLSPDRVAERALAALEGGAWLEQSAEARLSSSALVGLARMSSQQLKSRALKPLAHRLIFGSSIEARTAALLACAADKPSARLSTLPRVIRSRRTPRGIPAKYAIP